MARRSTRPDSSKIVIAPPSKKQCQTLLFHLRQGRFMEHAAILAGVSTRVLSQWIKLGRDNVPGFVEFIDMIDRADAELGDKLMTGVMTAIEDGDMSSLRWLYDKRFGTREKHQQSKWLELEDKAEQRADEDGDVTVQSLEEAEKQLEAILLAAPSEVH